MTIWLTSDTHFGHRRMVGPTEAGPALLGADGTPLRGVFADVDAMDEALIAAWNAVVRPTDRVYHLGDVTMRRSHLALVARLHGAKHLTRGNHDTFRTQEYLDAGFREIEGDKELAGLICTHVPVHPSSLLRYRGNVHGHLHDKVLPGPYVNVSVERWGYRPVTLEEVAALVPARDLATEPEAAMAGSFRC